MSEDKNEGFGASDCSNSVSAAVIALAEAIESTGCGYDLESIVLCAEGKSVTIDVGSFIDDEELIREGKLLISQLASGSLDIPRAAQWVANL